MSVSSNGAPKMLDLPIGLDAAGTRREFDSLGNVDVRRSACADSAQTRALQSVATHVPQVVTTQLGSAAVTCSRSQTTCAGSAPVRVRESTSCSSQPIARLGDRTGKGQPDPGRGDADGESPHHFV